VSAFLQYRFTDNGGDVAIGTIFMLTFLAGIIFLIYKLRSYQNIHYEEK
jgi:cbb3-type cytochrome oxidase subunit 3